MIFHSVHIKSFPNISNMFFHYCAISQCIIKFIFMLAFAEFFQATPIVIGKILTKLSDDLFKNSTLSVSTYENLILMHFLRLLNIKAHMFFYCLW